MITGISVPISLLIFNKYYNCPLPTVELINAHTQNHFSHCALYILLTPFIPTNPLVTLFFPFSPSFSLFYPHKSVSS